MYENIHVLNVCGNKFSWVYHENILTWKFFQLHIIEITVHVWSIMTSYFAIALLVLQRYLSASRLHTHSIHNPSIIQSSVTRPLQHQCYPSIAIRDKELCESHSQLIKPCVSLSSCACQWLQLGMQNKYNYTTKLYNQVLKDKNCAGLDFRHEWL